MVWASSGNSHRERTRMTHCWTASESLVVIGTVIPCEDAIDLRLQPQFGQESGAYVPSVCFRHDTPGVLFGMRWLVCLIHKAHRAFSTITSSNPGRNRIPVIRAVL